MFIEEVRFREIQPALSLGVSSWVINTALVAAYSDMLGAIDLGGYVLSTVLAGEFLALSQLQAQLAGAAILGGGIETSNKKLSPATGPAGQFETWVMQSTARLALLTEGKMYLVGTSPTVDIPGPYKNVSPVQSDDRYPAIDLITQGRQPSLDPLNPDVAPDAYPGGSSGTESPYGE